MSNFGCDRAWDLAMWLAVMAVIQLCCVSSSASAAQAVPDAQKGKPGVTHYVSAGGNDSSDGLSPRSAWQTIARVNSATLRPGDSVLFKRGDVWREQLVPVSGDATGPVTYGAYGKGAKPRIFGSVQRKAQTDWHDRGGCIWETEHIAVDVGNIILNEGKAVGIKVWARKDVDKPLKFYYDRDKALLAMYCEQNPAKRYSSIECALTRFIIDESNRSYVTYTDLDLRYGGAHGIGGWETSHIVVRDCDLSFIGGGLHSMPASGPVRYGNGIEFWQGAHDNLVERCRLWEIYDAALTNQGLSKNTQANIRYLNNIIWNCEYSFEYWNNPEDSVTENIHFENNTCVNAGHGWGHSQRPDPTGRHLMFYRNTARTTSVVVRNNIFYQTSRDSEGCLYLGNDWSASLTMDHNCWYQASGKMMHWLSDTYTMGEFSAYQAKTGKDIHSVAKDPRFINMGRHDFRPAPDSPVRRLTAEKSYAGALPCIGQPSR